MIILNDLIYPLLDELTLTENTYSLIKAISESSGDYDYCGKYLTRLYMLYISILMIVEGEY